MRFLSTFYRTENSATLGLHLRFSAKLRVWQVPACKMEPRSGMIMQVMTTHPATPVLAYLSTEWLLDRVSELSEGCLPAVQWVSACSLNGVGRVSGTLTLTPMGGGPQRHPSSQWKRLLLLTLFQKLLDFFLELCAVSPPQFEHLIRCPKLECGGSPPPNFQTSYQFSCQSSLTCIFKCRTLS